MPQPLQSLLPIPDGGIVDNHDFANEDSELFMDFANVQRGHSFTGNGLKINVGTLSLSKAGSPTGTAEARIYAHTGIFGSSGEPTGTPLAISATLDVSTLTGTKVLTPFIFHDPFKTVNATNYFFTLSYEDGDSVNHVDIGTEVVGTSAGNGARFTTVWIDYTTNDMVFRLDFLGTGMTSADRYHLLGLYGGVAPTPKTPFYRHQIRIFQHNLIR